MYAVHYDVHVRCSVYTVAHARRTCTPYMYGRGLILLWPRPIFRGCYDGQTAHVGCCIHYNNPMSTSTS